MLNWSAVRKLLIVILALVLVAIIVIPGYKTRKQSEIRQVCQSRLEQIAKAQEKYFAQYGKYVSELTEISGDSLNFTCPLNDSPFILDMPDSTHYKLSCPNRHGWFSEERASWKQE
jgi:type II secretory pathway pseudopilin PulG